VEILRGFSKVKIFSSKAKNSFQMVAGAKYFLKWAISYLSYNLSAPMFMCFLVFFFTCPLLAYQQQWDGFFLIFSQTRFYSKKKKSFCPRENIHHRKL
jgi:hypothetical protein